MGERLGSWWGQGGTVMVEFVDRRGQKAVERVPSDATLSVGEVALLMGVSRIAVQKWITSGKLPQVSIVQPTSKSSKVAQSHRRRGLRVLVSDLRKYAVERGLFMGVGNGAG
jgi:hypothetical protein